MYSNNNVRTMHRELMQIQDSCADIKNCTNALRQWSHARYDQVQSASHDFLKRDPSYGHVVPRDKFRVRSQNDLHRLRQNWRTMQAVQRKSEGHMSTSVTAEHTDKITQWLETLWIVQGEECDTLMNQYDKYLKAMDQADVSKTTKIVKDMLCLLPGTYAETLSTSSLDLKTIHAGRVQKVVNGDSFSVVFVYNAGCQLARATFKSIEMLCKRVHASNESVLGPPVTFYKCINRTIKSESDKDKYILQHLASLSDQGKPLCDRSIAIASGAQIFILRNNHVKHIDIPRFTALPLSKREIETQDAILAKQNAISEMQTKQAEESKRSKDQTEDNADKRERGTKTTPEEKSVRNEETGTTAPAVTSTIPESSASQKELDRTDKDALQHVTKKWEKQLAEERKKLFDTQAVSSIGKYLQDDVYLQFQHDELTADQFPDVEWQRGWVAVEHLQAPLLHRTESPLKQFTRAAVGQDSPLAMDEASMIDYIWSGKPEERFLAFGRNAHVQQSAEPTADTKKPETSISIASKRIQELGGAVKGVQTMLTQILNAQNMDKIPRYILLYNGLHEFVPRFVSIPTVWPQSDYDLMQSVTVALMCSKALQNEILCVDYSILHRSDLPVVFLYKVQNGQIYSGRDALRIILERYVHHELPSGADAATRTPPGLDIWFKTRVDPSAKTGFDHRMHTKAMHRLFERSRAVHELKHTVLKHVHTLNTVLD